ncbi:MAG: DUF480 domain-containing protein, partial [Planctomycetaceae bacterium]|nr:DUF480 domain-containing protein [Planctomycetaceae bacterium]
TNFSSGEIGHALRQLEPRGLVKSEYGARAERYHHRIDRVFDLTPAQNSLIALLFLRGPQTLHELLARSDFVSLHAPLNDVTQRVIDAAALAKMKPTACLINTSRGGLIDHAALWESLQQDRLSGAALDVFDPEPPDLSQPLFQDERVIVTPHAAFVSVESLRELRERTARQIVDVLAARRPEHVVNPEVLD